MQKVWMKDIESAVCNHWKIEPQALNGNLKSRRRVRPRQMVIYIARSLPRSPCTMLQALGKRYSIHHATVIHSQRCMADLVRTDIEYRALVDSINAQLAGVAQ